MRFLSVRTGLVLLVVAGFLGAIVVPVSPAAAGPVQGNAWAWGYGRFGQLGDSDTNSSALPVQPTSIGQVSEVSAGCYHSLAVEPDGSVWSWGFNGFGQLGNGTDTNSVVPVQVGNLTATAVAAGCYHSLAVKADGTVWAWGNNGSGELGIGGPASDSCAGFGGGGANCSKTPVQVPGLDNVMAVAAGQAFSLALKSDGTVWAWGAGYTRSPVQVPDLTGVTAIAAGGIDGIALKPDGTVWVWGTEAYGLMGGATGPASIPVQITQLAGVVAVSAGGYHNLALESDGTVWAWGRNKEGQIGIGSTTTSGCNCVPVPTQVPGLSDVTMVSGGLLSSFALTADGSLYAWGYDWDGELGNGTFSAGSPSPVQVSGLTNVVSVAGGGYHVLAIVQARSQAISFTGPGSGTYGGSATLTGTGGGSGNPVVFTVDPSATPGACTVSGANGTTVSYTGTGHCVIDANQAGGNGYPAAPQVQQTITVGPAPLSITASSPTMTQGDTVPGITARYSGFVNGDSPSSLTAEPTCSTTATSTSPAGAYPATCSGAADPDYAISYAPGTVTIVPPPCPAGTTANFRWHYSANGSSGSWSGTKTASCPGSLSMGPQAMEGDLKVAPGATLQAGYDLTIPGNNTTRTLTVAGPQVTFTVRCVSGATPTAPTFTVAMPTATYTITGDSWYPSGSQSSPLVYQGSATVPDLCGGGQIRLDKGGTFTATLS